jgi:hypothetical protein
VPVSGWRRFGWPLFLEDILRGEAAVRKMRTGITEKEKKNPKEK